MQKILVNFAFTLRKELLDGTFDNSFLGTFSEMILERVASGKAMKVP